MTAMTQDSSPSTEQLRLIRDALRLRYGVEPPAATTARLDALVTRIFALGPISQSTFRSVVTINAVQGDTGQSEEAEHVNAAEQDTIHAIAAEASLVAHELSPAVTAFLHQSTVDDAEWTRLLELLFQVLGRLDAIDLAPEWALARSARRKVISDVLKLQNKLEACEQSTAHGGRDVHALSAIASEMSAFQSDVAPAVAAYLQQSQPNQQQRNALSELIIERLVRLNRIEVHASCTEGKTKRKQAVDEVSGLLAALEYSAAATSDEMDADPPHTINQAEQDMIALIASEHSNVQDVLAPAVATFPRSAAVPNAQQARRHLSRLLFATVERLDAACINVEWEQAREDKRTVVRAVEGLQNTLDALPSCTEEQSALMAIATERSKAQFLLLPAVDAYLRSHPAPDPYDGDGERARLAGLLVQLIERMDAVMLGSSWVQAVQAREAVLSEVRRMQDRLTPVELEPPEPQRRDEPREGDALHLIAAERSKVQLHYTPAVKSFLDAPSERERARLSELFLQALEHLDAIELQHGWEEARQLRRSTVAEIQKLQTVCDYPPSSPGEHAAVAAVAFERSKIERELAPAVLRFTLGMGTAAETGRDRLRLSELSLRFLERLDAIVVEPGWEVVRKERKSAVGEVQKLQGMLDAFR